MSTFKVARLSSGLDDVIGIITAKQVLTRLVSGKPVRLEIDAEPANYVPETLTAMELVEQLRQSHSRLMLVVDEYGDVQGLVTVQDIMEAVTGQFVAPNSAESSSIQREDGSWLFDGLLSIPELRDTLDLKSVPDETRGGYQTLSGMIVSLLGRIPRTGDVVRWEQWQFEVVDLDGKRIDKVLASRIHAP